MKANGDMKHMDQVVIYIHGKGGNVREADHGYDELDKGNRSKVA